MRLVGGGQETGGFRKVNRQHTRLREGEQEQILTTRATNKLSHDRDSAELHLHAAKDWDQQDTSTDLSGYFRPIPEGEGGARRISERRRRRGAQEERTSKKDRGRQRRTPEDGHQRRSSTRRRIQGSRGSKEARDGTAAEEEAPTGWFGKHNTGHPMTGRKEQENG